ncbi:MAG: Polyketide cyclase / dehydrase and lipid transport [Actinomycetia bacterium]|nr:Polyketide cyclase / dehydrase and lipid transport [Actinomycetes bacterium]
MSSIRVSTAIDARPDEVWADVRDLGSHVEWMADAEAIRFTSEATSGVGATFDCDTKVGPLHLVDRMEVTEWVEGEVIGVRHVGLVTGTGRFTLTPEGSGTRFTWEESLTIPWWLGGPVATLVLRLVWVRNLRKLRRRFSR